MFSIKLSKSVQKFLDKADRYTSERVIGRLKNLRRDPYPSDSKFIGRKEEKIFRYRIGKYRALYSVDEDNNLVFIIKIDKRPRVYD